MPLSRMTIKAKNFGPARYPAGPNANGTLLRVFFAFCLCSVLPLGLILSAPLTARAYVPQGPYLLLLMTQKLGTASSLVVHQKVFIYGENASDVKTDLSETLSYRFSTAFRSESVSPGYKRIHVETPEGAVTILDGKISAQEENRFDSYTDLLLIRSRVLLQDRLSKIGIDPMVSSLGRLDGVPVYVLGSCYPDMSRSQIWIEKDTFRPLRLLIPEPDGQGGISILEFRYLQWRKNKKLWYPMQIQCYQNKQLIREIIVDEMIMNPLIADEVFDIDRLKAQYGVGVETEKNPAASGESSEIRKALDDFKKRYEY